MAHPTFFAADWANAREERFRGLQVETERK